MKSYTHKKPESNRTLIVWWLLAVTLVTLTAYLVIFTDEIGLSCLTGIPGFILLGAEILAAVSPNTPYKAFRRSSSTAPAIIVDKTITKQDESKSLWGGEKYLRSILVLLFFWILLKLFPFWFYSYSIQIEFEAIRSGSQSEKVRLTMGVSKRFYERHPMGAKMVVRYSTEDPSIAELEG